MTAPLTDPYAILGVATEASDEDLDHAFRTLVRQLHPDTRTAATSAEPAASAKSEDEADERLQELLSAYATLRDPIRRAAYDRVRAEPAPRVVAAAPRPSGPMSAPAVLLPDPPQDPSPVWVGPVHWEPHVR
ncbi:J domain-containing protein [Kribbella sp. NPDC054772]|jgi:curved DNA-binding protein CbpA